jgi:Transposase IS116/IS110/IS902 family
VLAEIGYDRARFASADGLKAFAVSAPITRASGKKPQCCTGMSRTGVWRPSARSRH